MIDCDYTRLKKRITDLGIGYFELKSIPEDLSDDVMELLNNVFNDITAKARPQAILELARLCKIPRREIGDYFFKYKSD